MKWSKVNVQSTVKVQGEERQRYAGEKSTKQSD